MAGKVESYPGEKYAYRFSEEVVSGHRIVGHSGGFPGINSQLDIYWPGRSNVPGMLPDSPRGERPLAQAARDFPR